MFPQGLNSFCLERWKGFIMWFMMEPGRSPCFVYQEIILSWDSLGKIRFSLVLLSTCQVTWCMGLDLRAKCFSSFSKIEVRAGLTFGSAQKFQSYLQQKAWSLPFYVGGGSARVLRCHTNCRYFSTSFPSDILGFRQGGNQTLHICYRDAVSGPVPWPYKSPASLEILSPCWVRHLLSRFC